jgi:hypothetical protein
MSLDTPTVVSAIVWMVDPDVRGIEGKEKRLARQPARAHLLTALLLSKTERSRNLHRPSSLTA